MLSLTTAIADGNRVVFFVTQLGTSAPDATIDSIVAAGRSFTPEEIPDLHLPPPPAPVWTVRCSNGVCRDAGR